MVAGSPSLASPYRFNHTKGSSYQDVRLVTFSQQVFLPSPFWHSNFVLTAIAECSSSWNYYDEVCFNLDLIFCSCDLKPAIMGARYIVWHVIGNLFFFVTRQQAL